MKSLLIANRGEIAIRIARAAAELAIRTVAVYSTEDQNSLHVRKADTAVPLNVAGPAAYLDIPGIIAAAKATGCDAIHPGYGFLSENAGFARACADAGLIFVGPTPEILDLFGDKTAARKLAVNCGVPVAVGTNGPARIDQIYEFLASLPAGDGIMIKAVAGGGGRGMRAVTDPAQIPDAYTRCQSEAEAFFGNGA